jgi:hypothetical protein
MNELLTQLKEQINSFNFKDYLTLHCKEILETVPMYKWYPIEESFINMYGKLCCDYSGDVEPTTKEYFISRLDNYSNLQEILEDIYTGNKEATYTSNCGWHFINFKNLLEEEFNRIKYELFDEFIEDNLFQILDYCNCKDKDNIYDDLDNTEIGDFMSWEVDQIFYNWLENTTIEFILE